ncbi:uncharacterized protein LOC118490359 [Helianthus annuus]|uniref:uncharacterized protein LOC118490359 n=1 Tax=Helianthus annuus TaxID=4232 RepID=UPI0016530120|nr:uncharacterized protein LOC118490359 [Helianthus annuus]
MDMEVRDLSEEETWVLEETKIRLRQLEDFHQRDLKQKSRSNWAKYGDDNTRYFHGCINKRRAANHLPGLMLRGIWETILTLIKREVLRFFRNKLRESLSVRPYLCGHGFKKLSDEDAEGLVRVISLQEINEAHFHQFGRLSMGVGSSYITLIPKKGDPSVLGDFRLINLIGIISKVVSKVLANRLKLVIGKLVLESQTAFLSGRYILDGPLMVNGVLSWARRSGKEMFMFKIDFDKTYDNVNWEFLIAVMDHMGFPPVGCNWIHGVLMSARSSVWLTGILLSSLVARKGFVMATLYRHFCSYWRWRLFPA